jgi:cytochrome P450 family 103
MLTSNGEAHKRRRSAFSSAFAFRAIAALRPFVRKVVDDLIDEWEIAGEIDFLDRFASELPARLIAHILGIPWADVPLFRVRVYLGTRVLSVATPASEFPAIETATRELHEYIERLCADRRASPRDDFLSAYLTEADAAGEMSPVEILIQLLLVIGAGSDTTRGALAIQTALLLQHRDQWDAVCRDPQLVAGAVAEALRFEPSVASFGRFALEDIEIDGHIISGGQFLQLSTMSAMRDETVFRDPDRFDIRRSDQQRWHLVFGAGAHRCLGEALARTELEEALAALTARVPGLQSSGPAFHVRGHTSIRQLGDMRVRWAEKLN